MKHVDDMTIQSVSGISGANHPVLQDLETYWHALRHAQRIPLRNDIQPTKIDSALPHTFILQRVAPGIARVRVAGQQLHDLLKMDARGMPISTFFLPTSRDQLSDLIEAAFSEPAIIAVPLIAPGSIVRAQVTGTMLLLPLRDDAGTTSRMLGAIVTNGIRGTRPRRFDIDQSLTMRHEHLGVRIVTAQSGAQLNETKRPDVIRPALRLIVNNG